MIETVIARADLAKLPEYSCTLPTGVYPGKRWRRNVNAFKPGTPLEPEWMLGEYIEVPGDPSRCQIRWSWAVQGPDVVHRGALR